MSSRYRPSSSQHGYRKVFHNTWIISWTFDTYIKESRLRFPRTIERPTDEAGLRRFCKKWGLELPKELR